MLSNRFILYSFVKKYFYLITITSIFHTLISFQHFHFAFRKISCPFYDFRQCFSFGQCIDGIECLSVLVGSEPCVSVLLNRSDSGIVDGFAVCPQPFSHFVQTLGHFFFDDTVRGRSYAQQQTTTFGSDFTQYVDNLLR